MNFLYVRMIDNTVWLYFSSILQCKNCVFMTCCTFYCLCDTLTDPWNVPYRYVLEGKMKTLSPYKHGRNGLFPKFWENKWQTVGSIISRNCIAFICELQAILCLRCDDEGPIRSLKMWSTSNPVVRHILGQQNPSWETFLDKESPCFGEQRSSEWSEPTAALCGQLATTMQEPQVASCTGLAQTVITACAV
jgi:hypothetical protein